MAINNLNYLDMKHQKVGDERRIELISDILNNGTFLPKTVVYKDIDDDFKRWVDEELRIVSDEGVLFPSFTLFSNQRFSEYSQSWSHTDSNNNLLLNFKTINRDNNPKYGKIQSGLWNIPGERFYTLRRVVGLDDSGQEVMLALKMKQPMAIDLTYKLGVFTTKINKINDFNTLVNDKFKSCQAYIRPNGHFMPMKLEEISDESEYNIDDRQFYSQTFTIKVMAYIINEDDYRVDELPMKVKLGFNGLEQRKAKKSASVSIEGYEGYYFDKYQINIDFPVEKNVAEFKMDADFIVSDVILNNVKSKINFKVNGIEAALSKTLLLKTGDSVEIIAKKIDATQISNITIKGIDPNNIRYVDELVNDIDYNSNFNSKNGKIDLITYFIDNFDDEEEYEMDENNE